MFSYDAYHLGPLFYFGTSMRMQTTNISLLQFHSLAITFMVDDFSYKTVYHLSPL